MLRLYNVSVRNILKDLNLAVSKGEFVIIVGENGAGKTTLFNTISGNICPSDGSILINGEDVTYKTQYERASFIANVFQDPKVGTIGNMSIRDNLNMAYMRGKSRGLKISSTKERDGLFREKLGVLGTGLEKRLDDYAGDLSGGQRQAMSVVMALLSDSKILLLDEITAALDFVNSEKILDMVNKNIYERKKTCLMITHNKEDLKKFGGNVMTLRNGRVV